MNKIIMSGNLTRSEIIKTAEILIWKSAIAVRGRTKDDTFFVNLVKFIKSDKQIEFFKTFAKGDRVLLSGRLEIKSYKDSQGVERKDIRVIVDDMERLTVAKPAVGDKPAPSVEPATSVEPESSTVVTGDIPF